MRRVIYFILFSPNDQRAGGGGALPDFFFFLFSPVQQVAFFGLATNALNVRNNKPSIASPTDFTLLSGEYRCWSFLDYVEDVYLAGHLLRSFQKKTFTLCTSFHNLHNLS